MVLRAFISAAGVPVAKAEVTGTIRLPNGRSTEIKLYDDGNWKEHGDDKANDGVYTATFSKNELVGSYQVVLKMQALKAVTATPDEFDAKWKPTPVKPFIRQAKSSFMVGRQELKIPTTEIKR